MRTFRTVRHLRRNQIFAQIAYRTRAILQNPTQAMNLKPPAYPGCLWQPRTSFLHPLQNQSAEDIVAGRFEFQQNLVEIGSPPDWNRQDLPKLWLYNLHYFDYLWSLPYEEAVSLSCNWIDVHRAGPSQTGWESYPTSLRVMNWCGLFFHKFRAITEADPIRRDQIWESIFRQTEWLSSHLETHLMGNHLLENVAALTVAGSCFNGKAATRWFQRGRDILAEQIPEQFLSDGGHFERSPMYHSRAVYLLLFLKNMQRPEIDKLISPALPSILAALKVACHPDGQIALLNDSAFGVYNEPSDLLHYASDLGLCSNLRPYGAFALPVTGYFGTRTANDAYVICDAGPIGPDHQPGHAHGDIFSFELSLGGQRVIVDSGVSSYEMGPIREYCRSTKAHNTIQIDRLDQCEFWGAFRVGRRARVFDVRWVPLPDGFELSGFHNGYRPSTHHMVHFRKFLWNNTGRICIKDRVTTVARSQKKHRLTSRLHLHPDCRIIDCSARVAIIQHKLGEIRVEFEGDGRLILEDSLYCPRFGQAVKNFALAWHSVFCQESATECIISTRQN